MAEEEAHSGFMSRWSRRKVQARSGEPVAVEPPPATAAALIGTLPGTAPSAAPATGPVTGPVTSRGTFPVTALATEQPAAPPPSPATAAANAAASHAETPPAPTLVDVETLTRDSDYSRFVARSVTPDVRNAALKKLFTDPHFNVMDGLDTYIGDYNTPDPLPPGMLRQMVQSKLLGLFDDDPEQPADVPPPQPGPSLLPQDNPAADENLALQLQPDDDARCAGPPGDKPGVDPDPAMQH